MNYCQAMVGKTQLVQKYCINQFNSSYEPTLGVEHFRKIVEDKEYNLNINFWDFSGNDDFIEIRNEFYKDSNAILFVFDLTLKRTLENLETFLKEAKELGGQEASMYLVGAKKDLGSQRVVQMDQAQTWAGKKLMKYFEVSSQNGDGIQELISEVIKGVLGN